MPNHLNWARNYAYNVSEIHAPETLEQVREIVVRTNRIKPLGTRHSFNDIADSAGVHVSLQKMNRVIDLDSMRNKVTVEAGIRYGELCAYLHQHGYALHNLASLPHISVAGAVATGTHGSGDHNGSLATAVHAIEVVTADGDVVTFSREQQSDEFAGAVVGLGAIGIVTKLTLDVVPSFQISQTVYENLPLAQLKDHFDDIFSSAYSVSLFTDWKDSSFHQLWVKHKITDAAPAKTEAAIFGAAPASSHLHPVPGLGSENCSEQMGIPGPWHERLPHFRLDFTPSAGDELQSEYIMPRQFAYDALYAIHEIRASISPLLHASEIRTVAADDHWLSPCYEQDSVAVHFTWKADWPAVRQVLPVIEQRLLPYRARPHWGKLFAMGPEELQPLYEKMPDFRQLLSRYDPQGKFRNAFLDRYIY
ncbi:FAD-binding protein [Cohnella caldifontis]|uniref:FAD-binding protein n=1 Tax=Cohnella caldifontis TaxID=3027471 RepID=UPI0023ECADE1|nr:FAD-binding protein [Cohnella sp. YIM B05605]